MQCGRVAGGPRRCGSRNFVPRVCEKLQAEEVEIRGDAETLRALFPGAVAASEEDYAAEFLGPVISVRIVPSLENAVAHINQVWKQAYRCDRYRQSEAAATQFATEVDTAAVMINASTRFNDGGEFGLGAEIGISTDKFHARGPCGLKELTSYKYVVQGSGQIRG